MGLHLIDIYRSPNIGVFMKGNDRYLLVPKGLAQTKTDKFCESLQVTAIPASIGESRLLGALAAMNSNGILVSRMAEDGEISEIGAATGMNVSRLDSKMTAVGNLVVANDRCALVSPVLDSRAVSQVRDVMGTEVERTPIGEYHQVGSFVVATNKGAAVYPGLDENEVARISSALGVEAYPTSVNRGVPFVASGLIANSKNAVAGTQTTGPELVFITRALGV
jgi:translation initiation factor 6